MAVDLAPLASLPRGWASDLEVLLRTGSIVEARGDHLVVRTVTNPGYHWGNLILVRPGVQTDDAVTWTGRFRAAFPMAEHVSIGLCDRPDPAPWEREGLLVESDEVLVAARPPVARAPAPGYELRPLVTPTDWHAAVELEVRDEAGLAAYVTTGWLAEYRIFAQRRWRARAGASQAGAAAFFGAFRDGDLVACLGIVLCSDHARFQSVLTDREHRRRGLAGSLLDTAGAWAAGHGATRWVIVVEPASPAARLYRRVGFAFDSLTWQASAH